VTKKKGGNKFQLRSGPSTGKSPSGESSWVCSPTMPVIPEPTPAEDFMRCDFSPEMKESYMAGCSLDCKTFDTLIEAKVSCDEESSCGGVTTKKGGNKFQLRSGPSLGKSPSGESTWVCQPTTPVRCDFSQEMKEVYIAGCSLDCKTFDTLTEAKVACDEESSCGGVTKKKGGNKFQLRSGPSTGKSPSGESSWVCSS